MTQQRKTDGKQRAMSDAVAVRGDVPTVQLDQLLHMYKPMPARLNAIKRAIA